MITTRHPWLVISALYELIRYDIVHLLLRRRGIQRHLRTRAVARSASAPADIAAISAALRVAGCLYWKPVMCLQRSVCLVRLLRRRGIPARLMIGYRPAPFFSHAWVEIEGRVVNDSPAYRAQLRVLLAA